MTYKYDKGRSDQFPRNFVFLLASDATGGEERYFMELAIAMKRTSTKPIIINLKTNVPYKAELEKHGVTIYTSISPNRFDLIGLLKLFRILKNLAPDALLINGNRQALWLGTFLSRCCRIPVTLIHTHSHMKLYSTTIKITSLFVDAVVAAAEGHRSELCNVYRLKPHHVVTIYPGIDLSRTTAVAVPLSKKEDSNNFRPWTVGIVAALRPEKDHETFLHAAALVRAEIPNTRFLIIGDGSKRGELEELAHKIGLGGNAYFLGWQKINANLLKQLDILTLSSYSETFPAVIIEAFSSGIPVVATDVGSVRELLGSPLCGILVPPRDPAALAEGLIRLIKNHPLANKISIMGLKRAELFSSDRFCEEILQLTCKLYNSQGKGEHLRIQ